MDCTIGAPNRRILVVERAPGTPVAALPSHPPDRRILVVDRAPEGQGPVGLTGTPFLRKLMLIDMSKVSINPERCFGMGNANQH